MPPADDDRSPTPVRVRVFGPVVIEAGGTEVVPAPGAAALIGYLALHGRARRDTVAFTLWPDRPDDRARRALSDAIYRLRNTVDVLATDAEWVALAHAVGVDLADFRDGIGSEPSTATRAARLASAPLLAELDATWVDDARAEVHRQLADGLAAATTAASASGDHPLAAEAAELWARADPYDERAHRALWQSLARLGRHTEALRRFDELVATLAAEVAVDPAPETSHLAARIRAESAPGAAPARGPLVGRHAERARLVELVERAAAGTGGLAVLLGDAGIGKTRLLDEVAGAAAWRGVTVARVAATESAPGALLDAVAAVLPDARLDQLADLDDPVWVASWRATRAIGTTAGAPGGGQRPAVAERAAMVRRLLVGVARFGPHLVLIDDAHWADDETWRMLADLRPALASVGVALIVGTRTAELRADPARRQLVADWEADASPVVVLGPLPDTDMNELLGRAGVGAAADVVAAAGGNPFVALRLAEAGGPVAAGHWADRLAGLDPSTRAVAALAAVVGRDFGYRTLRGDRPGTTAEALATLERLGVIEPAGSRHHFVHDLWRQAVLAGIEPTELVQLHALALDRLAADGATPARELLAHATAGKRPSAARRWAAQAGADALAAGDAPGAAAMLRGALDGATGARGDEPGDPAADRGARFRVLRDLAGATGVLAEPEPYATAVAALVEAGAQLGGWPRLEADRESAAAAAHAGRFAEAAAAVDRALARVADLDEPAPADLRLTVARLHGLSASVHRELGDHARATAACATARAEFAAADGHAGAAAMIDLAGGLAWRRGDYTEAARLHGEAATRFAELGLPLQRARALNNLGSAEWGRGDYAAAARSHIVALDLCRALGDRRGAGDNTDNLGGVSWALGDDAAAIGRYEDALAIRRATDDPWGVSISLANLGDVHRGLGEWDVAISRYDESLAVNAAAGVVRNDATTRMSRGLARLGAGDVARAVEELETAAALLADLGDRPNLVEATAGLVEANVALGQRHAAAAAAAALDGLVRVDDRPELRQAVALARAALASDAADRAAAVEDAWDAMQAALAAMSPECRGAAAAGRVVHARTRALWESLARFAEVPLASGAMLRVTVATPADPGGREGRLAAIRRITGEALAAGSTIGDEALAGALGVARRTILRDVEALRDDGVAVVTTGRR